MLAGGKGFLTETFGLTIVVSEPCDQGWSARGKRLISLVAGMPQRGEAWAGIQEAGQEHKRQAGQEQEHIETGMPPSGETWKQQEWQWQQAAQWQWQ